MGTIGNVFNGEHRTFIFLQRIVEIKDPELVMDGGWSRQRSEWKHESVSQLKVLITNMTLISFQDRVEEAKRHLEKIRDLNLLAEKLGCSLTQLSIAWTLKHEPVQCLLIGAKTTEQLTQSLQALQVSSAETKRNSTPGK